MGKVATIATSVQAAIKLVSSIDYLHYVHVYVFTGDRQQD